MQLLPNRVLFSGASREKFLPRPGTEISRLNLAKREIGEIRNWGGVFSYRGGLMKTKIAEETSLVFTF